jgi:hypothetical protein
MTSSSFVILRSDASEGAMDNLFICHASFYARVKGRDLMSEEQDEMGLQTDYIVRSAPHAANKQSASWQELPPASRMPKKRMRRKYMSLSASHTLRFCDPSPVYSTGSNDSDHQLISNPGTV